MDLNFHRIAQDMRFRLGAGSQDHRSYGDDDAVDEEGNTWGTPALNPQPGDRRSAGRPISGN